MPYKDHGKHLEHGKLYYKLHKKECNSKSKKYRNSNKEKIRNQVKTTYNRIRQKSPWVFHFRGAKARSKYSWGKYFKRGIKFLMTVDDFKYLWFRDEASNLKQPSIDRINNDGNYELNNCRFIEGNLNSSLGGYYSWKKGK